MAIHTFNLKSGEVEEGRSLEVQSQLCSGPVRAKDSENKIYGLKETNTIYANRVEHLL